MSKKVIVWFRNDLRLHDNEALTDALTAGDQVVPVFIFDERTFRGKTSFGFDKTGKYRAKFIIEAVTDLRKQLQSRGSDLYIRVGKPEDELFALANELKSSWIFCNRERTQEEVAVQDVLEHNLWSIGQEIRYCRGKMLYYTSDLPFPVTHTPDVFTQFRKEVERFVQVREPLPVPTAPIAKPAIELEWGAVPKLSDFGHDDFGANDAGGFEWVGGESEGLRHLQYYLWDTDLIKDYKETRNGLLGRDFSSKLSPYLSQGCLSPKTIYQEVRRYEADRVKNKSTYWLIFELLWRDFFRLVGKKYGNDIFKTSGTKGEQPPRPVTDMDLFRKWAAGSTGTPFVDANMKELNATGFMSNRGRQNVASYLVKDLNLDWRLGAEYFESLLLDYDPCSNYGNWNYVAGVGSDPREDRYFNILSQAKRYDADGEFVKYWVPELANVPADKIHNPDVLSEQQLASYGVDACEVYTDAIIPSSHWQGRSRR